MSPWSPAGALLERRAYWNLSCDTGSVLLQTNPVNLQLLIRIISQVSVAHREATVLAVSPLDLQGFSPCPTLRPLLGAPLCLNFSFYKWNQFLWEESSSSLLWRLFLLKAGMVGTLRNTLLSGGELWGGGPSSWRSSARFSSQHHTDAGEGPLPLSSARRSQAQSVPWWVEPKEAPQLTVVTCDSTSAAGAGQAGKCWCPAQGGAWGGVGGLALFRGCRPALPTTLAGIDASAFAIALRTFSRGFSGYFNTFRQSQQGAD